MSSATIGIDPGLTGAVALLTTGINGDILQIFDTPTMVVTGRRTRSKKTGEMRETKKTLYDRPRMLAILEYCRSVDPGATVWIEKVNAMPGQGVTSMFSMGLGYGLWLMAVTAVRLPLQEVHPATWKKVMMKDMGREKAASIYKAQSLWPKAQFTTKRGRKLDGRAEAALIAKYGALHS